MMSVLSHSASGGDSNVVFLKDQTFIPDLLRVASRAVLFCNDESDSTSYTLRCKRKFDTSDFTIEAGQSVEMEFPSTGRFEITNPCNGLMKVQSSVEQKKAISDM